MPIPTFTLLIVEDLATDRELYRRALSQDASCTYHLLEAESVAGGLTLCRTGSIDAILLDYALPDANGLTFLAALNAQNNGSSPPVVMVTGQGDQGIAVRAMKLGAEDYLVKSDLTPELLRRALRMAIENTRLRLQLQQSNDRLRISIDAMLDCYATHTAIRDARGEIIDFRFDYLNAAALESNQMTAADMSRGVCEVFPALRETGLFAKYCQVVATGVPLVLEELIYTDMFGTQQLTKVYDLRINKLDDGFMATWRDITAQKQAELTLQAKNEQITTIWESMTDAYVTLDRDWRMIYTNPTATEVVRQLVGLTPEEFLGKTHWEVFPWSVGNIVEQEYRRAVTDRVAVHFEVLYEPTGTWFEIHAYPSEIGLGIYFRDINERKQSELARIAAEQERDRFFDLSIDLLVIANLEGYFIRVNPACEQILGFTSAEMMAQPFLDFIHPDDRAATIAIVESLSAGNVLVNFENRYRCKDGSYRWILWSAIPDVDRNSIYANGHDITERKRDDEALRRSEEFNRSILDSHRDCVKVIDLEGRLLYMNDGGQRLMEIDDFTTVEGTQWVEFWQSNDAESVRAALAAAKSGEIGRFEGYCATFKDMPKWWEVVATPILDPNGNVEQILSVSRDITDRKQTQIALQIGEELFRSTFENTSVGMAHVAIDGNWIRVNPRLCEILGYSSAELLATTYQAITAPADADEDVAVVEQLLNGEINESTLEKRYIHKQGHYVWSNLTVTLIRTISTDGQLGIPQYFIAVIQDITERKQLEAQLRQRESQLQLFVKYVPAGVAMFDRDMRYLVASDVWIDCHELHDSRNERLRQREIVGRSHYDLYPNLPQKWKEMHQRCLAGAIESCEEDLFPRPDGSIDWVRWGVRPWYTDTDEVGGIVMFSEIITDLKLRSAALLQSERKFSAIFNQTFQLMGLVSLDGVVLEVNQAALDSIAAPESEIIGKSFWDAPWWHTEQLQQQLRDAIATAASGQFVRYEVEFPNPNGGVMITDFSLKPIFDEVGQVESIVAEGHDITDRKQAQADLEQRNQELDSFVYVVSHDLKAPLRGIANLSEWIEEDLEGSLTVANQQQMALLRSRVYKMEATIDGLLEYARLGIADVGTVESVSIAELLADVIDSIAPPPTFRIALPPELPTLSTRRLPLFQVLANLIGNGIKHHDAEDGSIVISIEDRGDCYEFAVSDDGPGIAPEHHDRMFKIFQAVNPQNRSDSTGIGLAIVKKIVEAEGGTIWLESELGKGTTFYFTWLQR